MCEVLDQGVILRQCRSLFWITTVMSWILVQVVLSLQQILGPEFLSLSDSVLKHDITTLLSDGNPGGPGYCQNPETKQ